MNVIQAILLGIIQGLTEFLPISSTAHLTIAGKLTGLVSSQNPDHWTAFIAVIQMGTLAAVLFYFYKDIINIISSFFKENLSSSRQTIKNQSLNSRLGWYILFGSVPIVVIGFGLKKLIEGALTKNLTLIAVALIVLALILALAEKTAKFKKEMVDVSLWDAILVGFAQCLALLPGASRSGTTITAGLFLGMKRETAARFSFLLSIPAVFGSGLYEFYKSLKYITSEQMLLVFVATLFAAVSGYLSIAFLLKFLKTNTTWGFIIYRVILGAIILAFLV